MPLKVNVKLYKMWSVDNSKSPKSPRKVNKKSYQLSYKSIIKDMSKGEVKNTTKDRRVIPLPKAIKIMQDYKKNNFNAYKTLIENGYSESYANDNSKYTIQACTDRINESLALDESKKDIATTVSNLYEAIGLTREDVLNELVKIIKQDLNYAVKLRALEPFVRQEGIKWDEKETQQAQSVSIVLKEVEKPIVAQDIEHN